MEENYEETLRKYKPKFTVEEEKRDVICLKLTPEKGKEEWCLWCDVIIDCSAETLTIYSDRGNYQYHRTYGSRTDDKLAFLKGLLRVSEWSFLDHIAERTEFNFEESHKNLEEFLEESFEDELCSKNEDLQEEAQGYVNEILETSRENNSRISAYWFIAIEKAFEDIGKIFDYEELNDLCVEGYPHYAESMARVFVDDIQPAIQKIIAQREEQEWGKMVEELEERTQEEIYNDKV